MTSARSSSSIFALAVQQQGQGLPILCLHGHPGSAACMAVFTDALAPRFWTIAPDLRGYGASRVRSPFSMTDHLLDLERLLDQLQVPQCIVLGWSLGGILALELALRDPQRVAGLILVATAAHPVSNLPPYTPLEIAFTLIAAGLNRIHPGWQWNIDTFGRRSLLKDLLTQQTPTAYRWLNKAGVPATVQTSRHADAALRQALQQRYNRTADLPQIHCPCLVLSGANDRHILSQASQETAEGLPHSQWICYPKTAHLFPWEVPDQVNQDIAHWLNTTRFPWRTEAAPDPSSVEP